MKLLKVQPGSPDANPEQAIKPRAIKHTKRGSKQEAFGGQRETGRVNNLTANKQTNSLAPQDSRSPKQLDPELEI